MTHQPGVLTKLATALVVISTLASAAESSDKASSANQQYPTFGNIVSNDPRFDKIVGDAKLEKLAEGFDWSEGPVWVPDHKVLLFSDIPPNRVMKWSPGDRKATVFMEPAGYTGPKKRGGEPGSNGLLLDPQGRLIQCEHGDRRVSRVDNFRELDPAAGPYGKDAVKKTTLADKYQGKRLNSPNDAVLKSNGDLYFTDPPYGLEKNWDDPARELDFCGVYRLSKDGELTLLTKEMTRPNGIAFSPDEKTLYVAQSDPKKAVWMAFDVKPDGTIANGRVFYDASKWVNKRKGLPDGLKVDQDGILFTTGPGGVLVFAPDGTHLGTIETGEATANVGWGDDGSTLYITADMYLARIKLNTTGLGFDRQKADVKGRRTTAK